ncbi:hypothetical protein SOVF_196940, partial [Spinacia oleracea]
MLAVNNGFRK